MKYLIGAVMVSAIVSPVTVKAADGLSRDGLYLSAGLGVHSSALESHAPSGNVTTEAGAGPVLSVKLGGYINPRWALYYHGRSNNWYENYEDALFIAALNGIGATYYFSPISGNGYLEASLGLGTLMAVASNEQEVEMGTALSIGLGYEVTRHFQVGVSYFSVAADDSEVQDVEYKSTAIALTADFKL